MVSEDRYGFGEMRSFLCFATVLGSTLLGLVPNVGADAWDARQVTSATEEKPQPARIDEKQARARLAASAAGIVLSTVGLAIGIPLVLTPDTRQLGPDYFEDVRGAGRKRTAGKVLLVVSPLALGASIFGVVRSKRNRLRAQGKTNAPREPASWR